MTVAVETQRETYQPGFDWDFAEAQFSEAADYIRPPEAEIYGRSLSTIRRLGAFMIDKSSPDILSSPEAAQAKVEFYTSVEEGFGTDMELGGGLEVRAFDTRPVIGGRVMCKDLKTPISSMTENGLKCAVETARHDQRFLPQLMRSKWDHENALIVDQMARGETDYNTRIVVSPFPEEGAAQSGDEYWRNIGYVPHLRRGFVQFYHATGGKIISGSLSFDGSNKQRLRHIFQQASVEIPPEEVTDNWVKYAITDSLLEEDAKALATTIADAAGDVRYEKSTNTVQVTKQNRLIMERAFNESYVHICESLARGRQTDGAQDLISRFTDKAHNFKRQYAAALYRMRANREQFSDDDSVVLHELLVYSTIEMMRALHLAKIEPQPHHPDGGRFAASHLQSVNPSLFQSMLGNFGADGAINNRVYSACGLSISLGEDKIFGGIENPQSVFGGIDNMSREELSWHGGKIKKGTCVNCKKHTDVGVKNWCKSCIRC